MINSVILHFVSSFNDSMIYRIAFRFNYAPSINIHAFFYNHNSRGYIQWTYPQL